MEQARANRRLAAILDESKLEGVEAGVAILSMDAGWAAMAKERMEAIEALFTSAADRPMRVEIRTRGMAPPAVAAAEIPAPSEPIIEDPTQHPLVREAVDRLRARVVSVQPRQRPAAPRTGEPPAAP